MITKQEITSVELSPTKKDFYQLWNELIDLADKLSANWSPRATNESDPGIVLLKLLVAVADKLNYNLDMNTREGYMPSATQLESMRKLCDMMGYSMHHYISATGTATISFKDSESIALADMLNGVYIPRFTNLQDTEENVNYVTLKGITLYSLEPSRNVDIIEGQLVDCETNNDNIVTINHLDDSYRYFLPEKTVAENGIFVFNIDDNIEDLSWTKVSNLNITPLGTKAYKFGFDSSVNLPYIQFPDDISQLIGDGLRISYIRTSGVHGNIALKTLSKLVPAPLWKTSDDSKISGLTADNFTVVNNSDIVNGRDLEGIDEAYNNYKKTIGTFDTLITCRDYMNKIYQLTKSETNTTPLVSNIIVSDIRNDINRAHILCSMDDYGISYKTVADSYADNTQKMSHFDLVFYPFKTIVGTGTKTEYDNSFEYTRENSALIENKISNLKTIAHNITYPENTELSGDEIVCIKNYLKLRAKITTVARVSLIEEREIRSRIYGAIYENFNARKLEFGEEIPTDTIEKVIKMADPRIKDVNLDEPILDTVIKTVGDEYHIANIINNTDSHGAGTFNKIVLKNVLAGRVQMFKYNKDFAPSYAEKQLSYANPSATDNPPTSLPQVGATGKPTEEITNIEAKLTVDARRLTVNNNVTPDDYIKLADTEVIQFKAPNFKTVITYPAYVNYYFVLDNTEGTSQPAVPATFMKLNYYMDNCALTDGKDQWTVFANTNTSVIQQIIIENEAQFNDFIGKNGALFTKVDNTYTHIKTYQPDTIYFAAYIADADETKAVAFSAFNTWLTSQKYIVTDDEAHQNNTDTLSQGLCRNLGTATLNVPNIIGEMVDANCFKYTPCISAKSSIDGYYVQETWTKDSTDNTYTADGIGKDAIYHGVPENGEYQLKGNDKLYINYTKASAEDSDQKTEINMTYSAEDNIVIRANFELVDSALYHSSHSYSKRDGFNFPKAEVPGMFTLGTNQQIEIREQVTVTLNSTLSKLYWFFHTDTASMKYFTGPNSPFGASGTNYTLQDDEYIFYSNEKETDYNYYGPGSTIKLGSSFPVVQKNVTSDDVTLVDILSYGLEANIPWVNVQLNKTDRKIVIEENQFLSLTEDDLLCQIKFADNSAPIINSGWTPVETAKYRLSGSDVITTLPKLAIDNLSWEVRTKVDFKVGPETSQKISTTRYKNGSIDFNVKKTELDVTFKILNSVDSAANGYEATYTYTTDKFNLEEHDIPERNSANFKVKEFVFKTNYNIQQATSNINILSLIENYNELLENYGADQNSTYFKMQFNELTNVVTQNQGLTVSLNNFGTNFTRYGFDLDSGDSSFNLNISMPYPSRAFSKPVDLVKANNGYGLISVYFRQFDSTHKVKLTTSTNALWLYNNTITADFSNEITLAETGLYCIGIAPGVSKLTIGLYNGTTPIGGPGNEEIIIFSNLSLIDSINPKLCYQGIANTPIEQLLQDINKYDKDGKFLYNTPINSSIAIDMNEVLSEENMAAPEMFYDKNNLANKFVISEIDSDELSTGIILTKSSKL